MGRKALEDGMQKTLSVRVTEKVAAVLESARVALERSGERASTSDVARQVLDSIVERNLPLGFSMDIEESLRGILRALRDDLPLSQHDYALLAEQAHQGYLRNRKDFVRADLLLNNLSAFEAYIRLRNDLQPSNVNPEKDRYYFGNLGSAAQQEKDIFKALGRAREVIAEQRRPYRSTAEFMSRNLTTLRDDIGLPSEAIDRALRPFVNGLLLLALQAYSSENGRPVSTIENRIDLINRMKINASPRYSNDAYTILFVDGNESLAVLITPTSQAWDLSLDYLRFIDFVEIIELERSAESQYFSFLHQHQPGNTRLSVKGANVGIGIYFSAQELATLREAIQSIMTNPEYRRVLALFELRYGSI
jgi:hypothetical protein